MGVQTNEVEIELAVPPSRIFKATTYDFPTLAVIIVPQLFKKIDVTHGDGGVGTIRILHLPEGIFPMDIIKERVETVNDEKLFYSVTMIQGPFPTGVEKIQNDLTFTATADEARTIIKRKDYFYTTGDTTIDEIEIASFNERATGIFKAFETYLVANPNA